ncbi:MAG TPA: GGDEF domain-containing protein [Candidatus Saccharimonadia bacterium]|nr:GGDEF domain-containing protein [Candidatus Saccharimonadia bacterium]
MSAENKKRFEDSKEQAAYEQGLKFGEPAGRFLGMAIKKHLENQDLSAESREHKRQATHDPLTGLLNRRGLEEYLSSTDVTNHVILYADVTNMKAINDKLGHVAGDRAIVGVAEVLTGALRERDIVARIGGDEFLAILAPIGRSGPLKLMPPEEQLEVVINRITERKEGLVAENPGFTTHGFDIAIGAVVGQPGQDIGALQASAEERMVEDKVAQHSRLGAYRN